VFGHMETFILIVSLAAAAGGALVLLSHLAGHRATLLRAFELEEQTKEREYALEKNKPGMDKEEPADGLTVVTGSVSE